MTPGRKASITKQYNKFKFLIDHPGHFVSTTVSAKRAESIKSEAYSKKKGRKVKLFFKAQKVSVRKHSVYIEDGYFDEEIFDAEGLEILRIAEREFARLKKGDLITVRIGSSAPFNRRFVNFRDFENYITGWSPKDANSIKDDLISQMSIVHINREKKRVEQIKNRQNRR